MQKDGFGIKKALKGLDIHIIIVYIKLHQVTGGIRFKMDRIVKAQRKVIGHIKGDTFFKDVKRSKHLLRQWNAWCVDADAYDEMSKGEVFKIIITDQESGIIYYSTTENFEQNRGTINLGHGTQYFLNMKYWTCYAKNQLEMELSA